ncbi:hypothetical protein BS78_K278700 [Paspalum vaginatum]|uniref:Uncharacterized protein n=1 Tax=Paspalum vaginatum TaxID=158149 RepID=A0A9W7XBC7_9POAL|nr:hypothetical protein BS78_K278700 [Paspalum vaginatum]
MRRRGWPDRPARPEEAGATREVEAGAGGGNDGSLRTAKGGEMSGRRQRRSRRRKPELGEATAGLRARRAGGLHVVPGTSSAGQRRGGGDGSVAERRGSGGDGARRGGDDGSTVCFGRRRGARPTEGKTKTPAEDRCAAAKSAGALEPPAWRLRWEGGLSCDREVTSAQPRMPARGQRNGGGMGRRRRSGWRGGGVRAVRRWTGGSSFAPAGVRVARKRER